MISEWFNLALAWIKARLTERTTYDGTFLIACGVCYLLFKPLMVYLAYAAIVYGAWTLLKSEQS